MLIKRQNWGFFCGRDWTDRYSCVLAWSRKQPHEAGALTFKHNLRLWPLFNFLWYRWRSPWGRFYDFPICVRRW